MKAQKSRISAGQMIFSAVWILLLPVLLLALAGDWFWIQGWIFNIWYIVLGFSTVIYLYFKDPELFLERLRKPGTGGEKGGISTGFIYFWCCLGSGL